MSRLYVYVGTRSEEIQQLLQAPADRACVTTMEVIRVWIEKHCLPPRDVCTVTYVIDAVGALWIADQRSEHVVCAQGQAVMAAGEMTFAMNEQTIEVIEVTNQSTGYCPEPESSVSVFAALDRIGLAHPPAFTTVFVFRRCDSCGTTNLIKDDHFECAVCSSPLSLTWNYADRPHKRYL